MTPAVNVNGQLLRPLVVIGAAAIAALFLLGMAELAETLTGVESSDFVRLVLLLSGVVGGGAAGAAYVKQVATHD